MHAHIEALVYVDALLAINTEDGHQEAEECKNNLHLSSVKGAYETRTQDGDAGLQF